MKTSPKILTIALQAELLDTVTQLASGIELTTVKTEAEFVDIFENLKDGDYAVITAGNNLAVNFLFEVGQIIQNQCPTTPNIALLNDKSDLDLKKLKKNGFKEVCLLPLDKKLLKDRMHQALAAYKGDKVFRKVKSLDVAVDSLLEFDTYVYLPLNNKYIKYSRANEKFVAHKSEKLQKHNVGSLHIEQKDLDKFYVYVAESLAKNTDEANPLSATERQDKLNDSVRGLIIDMYDYSGFNNLESGKEMVTSCQKVISTLITKGKSKNWYNELLQAISGEVGGYSHVSEVSTLAALFALIMEQKNPEDFALAGFLHDLGMIDIPEEQMEKPQSQWTEEERTLYYKHPERSLNYIKKKRMIVSESVEKMIAQHHEMYNGQGFPKQLVGDRLPEASQILILADQFQYLMEVKEGHKRYTPEEALTLIEQKGYVNPYITRKVRKALKNEENV